MTLDGHSARYLSLSCFVFMFLALPCRGNALYLNTLQVLNSTKDLNTSFQSTSIVDITNNLGDVIGCYEQAPPHQPQLSRTNYIDCFNAEKKIAALDTHRPMQFRRNQDSTFVLPNCFTYRTCVILLDMVSADAEDTFYVGQIGSVAIDLARRCTAFRFALGGKGTVGPKNLMEVEVFGRM